MLAEPVTGQGQCPDAERGKPPRFNVCERVGGDARSGIRASGKAMHQPHLPDQHRAHSMRSDITIAWQSPEGPGPHACKDNRTAAKLQCNAGCRLIGRPALSPRSARRKASYGILGNSIPARAFCGRTGDPPAPRDVQCGAGRCRSCRHRSAAGSGRDPCCRNRTIYTRTPESVVVSQVEPIALEHGRWEGVTASGRFVASGTYTAKWRNPGGDWVIEAELYLTLA